MRAFASAELGPGIFELPADEVHLWHVATIGAPLTLSPLLSPDERARAATMRFGDHRWQYSAVRAALRRVLAGYLHTDPRAIDFSYGRHGRPVLHPRIAGTGIAFSVSHAGARGVIAVARTAALGVDIERVVDGRRALGVAGRFFAAREAAALRALSDGQLPYGFTAVWTRKEAYVKALGQGLTLPLADFEVTSSPNPPAVVRCAASDPHAPEAWTLTEIVCLPGHVCTVAVAHRVGEAPPQGTHVRELSIAAIRDEGWERSSGIAC